MTDFRSERLALELQLGEIDATLQILRHEMEALENSIFRRLSFSKRKVPVEMSNRVTTLQFNRQELRKHLDLISKIELPTNYNNSIDLTQEQKYPAEQDGEVTFLGSVQRTDLPEVIDLTRSNAKDRLIYGKSQSRDPTPSQNNQTPPGRNLRDIKRACTACFEKFQIANTFAGKCGHIYCRGCLRNMFLTAVQDEQFYPPKCCKKPLKPKHLIEIMTVQEIQAYEEKGVEYSTVDRLYCAEPTCSKFIPESRIKEEHGKCLACKRKTHKLCRSLAHPGIDCPNDKALQQVLKIAKSKKWMRCPSCRTMVERTSGCAHIYCKYAYISYLFLFKNFQILMPYRCGCHFCHVCGGVNSKWICGHM